MTVRKKSKSSKKSTPQAPGKQARAERPPVHATPEEAAPPDSASELFAALVLGVVAYLRPEYDGMAMSAYNTYFLWGGLLLFALVAARLTLRGEGLRFGGLVALLTGFLLVALATGCWTAQYNNTYRALLVWTGHLFIFTTAACALRSPRSLAIALGAFVVGASAEAVYSVAHAKCVLPLVRAQLELHPELAARYFSSGGVTDEIAHRVNSNRAFGSFLFANALAGFMVLAVPPWVGGFRL